MAEERSIVIPGDLLSEDPKQAGEGTYIERGKVYSALYGLIEKRDKIRVIPLTGKYIPSKGDVVIGKIVDITFSNWIVDINSPYEALLHISEYPEKVDQSNMDRYIKVGDLIIAKVVDVDATMKIELSMRDDRSRVLKHGRIIDISHTKVPRVIGRNGSMISMLKKELNCSIFIGQNGRIWIRGEDEMVDLATKAILKIEKEAHTAGLTDRIKEYINSLKREIQNER
ncbi:MAG: exosome complex RNA-binding protein Rrp4 [Methanocellales archaeon]